VHRQPLVEDGLELRLADARPAVGALELPQCRVKPGRAEDLAQPDVWEVIKFLREVDERGPAAIDAAAEVFAVDTTRISTATSYYGDYSDEIDAEIAAADEASARAEAAWRVQQQLTTGPPPPVTESWLLGAPLAEE
jgi:hypothetical protein